MSWWDTSQFTSLASNAIKNAQKKIDKVLDIPVEDEPEKPRAEKAANQSWAAWGSAAAFSPTTPKSSSFSEPKSRDRNTPSPSLDSPRSTKSGRSNRSDSPALIAAPQDDLFSTVGLESPRRDETKNLEPFSSAFSSLAVAGEPIAASSPAAPQRPESTSAESRGERRTARRQKSGDRPPPQTKKLGAKLGAVKVQKIVPEDKPEALVFDTVVTEDEKDTVKPEISEQPSITHEAVADFPENKDTKPVDSMELKIDIKSEIEVESEITSTTNELTATQDDQHFAPEEPNKHMAEISNTSDLADNGPKHFTQPALANEEPISQAEECEAPEKSAVKLVVETNPDVSSKSSQESSHNTGTEETPQAELPVDPSSQSAITEQEDLTVKSIDSDLFFVAADNGTELSPNDDNGDGKNQASAEPEVKEQEEDQSSDTISLSESNTVVEIQQLLIQDTSTEDYEQHEGGKSEKSQEQAAVEEKESVEEAMMISEESLTPAAGSAADLISKSASSDGTVIDQEGELLESSDLTNKQLHADDSVESTENTENTKLAEDQMLMVDITTSAASDSNMSASLMNQSTCSDNSYVKCELPSSFIRTNSSNDFQRGGGAPSEFSDLETGTSSDIEIISMASTYGEGNGEARMMDFVPVPLTRAVFKTKIREISPDELSQASSQTSPCSDREEPGVHKPTIQGVERNEVQGEGQTDTQQENNPLETQTLLRKLAQLTEVLEARETRQVALSRENGELLEVNAHLKRRIEQMEETNGDLDLVKDEFGQRLHELERKLQNALREKEMVKKQLLTTQEELHNRAGTSGKMQRIVEDKDETISALMAEGEKLQKQQLTSNNLIKKLRKKEKEADELNRDHKDKIDSQTAELERLKAVLDSKIQVENKHTDMIKQLNQAVSNYQVEISKLKSDTDEATEKMKRAESAVDNSYKEIAELHKSVAGKESLIKDLRQENEAQLKEELHMALEKKSKEALRDADHLTNQIEDMQLTLSRLEKEHQRREERLRQENQDLLYKLENSDKRNEDLTQSVAAATKPLLRQIENLQSSYSAQSLSWEKLEKNLTDRLAEAQNQLATATEKERIASENAMESSSRINILETQLSALKQEKSKLTAELEMCKIKLSTLQDERNSAVAQLESFKSNAESEKTESRKSYTLLENKLELERTKLDTEKKKYVTLMEQLSEKEQQITDLSQSRLHKTPSPSLSGEDGKSNHISNSRRTMKQDELLERALSTSSMMGSSLYDNIRNHSTTSFLENLESQVKQKEGEILQLQADISEHEKTRESLTKEMVKLTEENTDLSSKIKQLQKMQQQYKELNGRYQALLQMYGEKEEQVTELSMDLMDVKQMYKQQIDALMSK